MQFASFFHRPFATRLGSYLAALGGVAVMSVAIGLILAHIRIDNISMLYLECAAEFCIARGR